MIKFVSWGLAFFLIVSVTAGAAMAGTLEEELADFIFAHPLVRAGQSTVRSSGKAIDIAKAGYYPTLAATGSAGPQQIDNPTTRAQDGVGKTWSRSMNTAGLTLTQNLFSGYLTDSTVRTARLNKALSQMTLEGTLQGTIFEGVNAYVDILRQLRLVQLAHNNEATIQRQLNLEDERVQRGSGIAVDVLQAKSRLQIAKERRISFEGALEDAVSRYSQVFEQSPNIESMTDPVPPVEMIPSELNKTIEIALHENPAISSSAVTVEMTREGRRTLLSEYSPVIDVVGAMNYEKHNAGTLGTRRDQSVLLQASWNLFTGFSTPSGVDKATFDYSASRSTYDQTVKKVIEQVKLSWQALLTSRQRLELLENAVNIASEVFISRKKLREAGKETVINVLDAENEVSNAQINYTAASYDERVSIYQLLLAMGRLNPSHLKLAMK
ncbi:MAG: TolC family outer membrane protein [Rhodospirillaceae bacterium]|nr:TolC family outer membrane protein [Rhodospirillaceae bacterium]